MPNLKTCLVRELQVRELQVRELPGVEELGDSQRNINLCGVINSESRLKPTRKKASFNSFCAVTEPTENLIGVTCLWKDSCKCSSLM